MKNELEGKQTWAVMCTPQKKGASPIPFDTVNILPILIVH